MMRYYAGIGARSTPKGIQEVMKDLGSMLGTKGIFLRSGAAKGADTAFEEGCKRVEGPKEIYLPWIGFNYSTSVLHPREYPFTPSEMEFTKKFHPAWDKISPSDQKFHYRNTRIILGMEYLHGPNLRQVEFVICWTQDGAIQGGTAQPIRIARAMGIPVFNLGSCKREGELEAMIWNIHKQSGG